tara:strand:- start:814 stop:2058 length:1245 start_codon:yes stop_codon:yes gene_type:complete
MEHEQVAFFEKKGRLFYQLILSTFGKAIAVISLFIYAKVITKNEVGEIAYIQAIVVFLVTILSLQLPAAIFRFSLEKKYQNISLWIVQNSNYFFYISLIFFTINFIYPNFIFQVLLLCLIQIAAQIKLEIIRTKSSKSQFFKLILFQVFFSVALTSFTLILFKDVFNGVLVFIFFEYFSWFLTLVFCSKTISGFEKDYEQFKPIYKKEYALDLMRYGVYLIPTSLSWAVILHAPLILTEFFYDDTIVANFTISNRLPLVITMVSVLILQVIGKNLILMYEDNAIKFCQNYLKYSFFWLIYCSILSVIVYFLNYIVILNMFPSYKISEQGQILQFLNAFTIANFAFVGFFYQIIKRLKYNVITATLTATVGFISGYIFGISYGIEGILVGMFFGLLVGLTVSYIYIIGFIKRKNI